MEYLYFLQQLREACPTWFNESILFISEFCSGIWGLALMALVYWCISKKAGTLLLMSFSLSQVCNNIVKNILKVERPFNRDARLYPYVPATGYSFPSGHTMMASTVYGSIAVWQRKRKLLAGFFVFMMVLTAFTRNWLGAHTIEDVVTAIVLSCGLIALNCYLLDMVEAHPRRDLWVFAGAVVLCLGFCVAFPGSMHPAGMYGGVMVGWIIERRFIGFEVKGSVGFRAAIYVPGMVLVGVCNKLVLPAVFAGLDSNLRKTLTYFFTFLLITAVWPAVIKLIDGKRTK